MSLRIPEPLLIRLAEQAVHAFPRECCGVLIGSTDPRNIVDAVAVANRSEQPQERHFAIDPRDLMRIERDARQAEMDVIGFYHSHPNGSALPSETDREAAWPVYSYVIVATSEDGAGEIRSWRLEESAGTFVEETIETI